MRAIVMSHPGIASIVGGVLFALLLIVFGGARTGSPLDLILPALLGLIFGATMFAAPRRGWSS